MSEQALTTSNFDYGSLDAETHVERFADALRPILDRYSGLPWGLSTVSRMVCMALRDSGLELVTIEDANALREEEA